MRALVLGAGMLPLMAHTPYRQWQVYRRKHLLIGTHRADPDNYPLGKEIAAALAESLPESHARVTRGPDALRLASLLTTGQLDVVLLEEAEVAALAEGAPPFDLGGGTELCTLARAGDYRLIVRPGFPSHHAWQIASALPPMLEPTGTSAAPLHPGVDLFLAGQPMPEPPEADRIAMPDHSH